jgi:hypothetical protein
MQDILSCRIWFNLIKLFCFIVGALSCIRNTLFSSQLMNEPNEQECFFIDGFFNLA